MGKSLLSRSSAVPFFQQADLLCFSHLRWHFVTQRPQHLMARAARDRRVFFWEEPVWHNAGELPDRPGGGAGMFLEVEQPAESIWLLRPHLTWGTDFESGQRTLLDEAVSSMHIGRHVSWYYTPMAWGFSNHLQSHAVVYDCMDELKNFAGAPVQLHERESQLLAAADVVFTGGHSLYDSKRESHGNVHAFPSSIDKQHFARAKQLRVEDLPHEYSAIPQPRAGFYGVLDERFDIALLADVARLCPAVHFIMVGPVVKIDPALLPKAANIHYLGAKAYEELPHHLAAWDIALLPFAINEATRFISPTKTPEYLAAGKRVVSTPVRDVVRDYGDENLVAIAGDADLFAAAVQSALLPASEEWQNAVTRKLAPLSWDRTWSEMRQQIDLVFHAATTHGMAQSATQAPSITVVSRTEKQLAAPPWHREDFDYLIAGAGFAGAVLAERLAQSLHARVLVVDRRDHIAGNAYDYYNTDGILVHKYGPHIFHTNADRVAAYLSRFTAWRGYEHHVLASVAGRLLPVPINLNTINGLYGLDLDAAGMEAFLKERVVRTPIVRTSEDLVLSRVGPELYEMFFKNYTRKQWGLDPSELDASVAGRIPVRLNHDNRYFDDSFQAMPRDGYTRMFERILDHPNITVRTGVDFQEARRTFRNAKVVFTGPIDEYYGFRFGALPYRSLEFQHETHDCEWYQAAPVVNYPNDHAYTRVTEFKYLTGQQHAKTSIVREFPRSSGDPYYPVPRPENAAQYASYKQLAENDNTVRFCGRLANYRYFNMDQVVAQALATFQSIADERVHRLAPPVGAGDNEALRRTEVA